MSSIVPNLFPLRSSTRRIAIIGECATERDANWHVCDGCGAGAPGFFRCTRCYRDAIHRPTPLSGPPGNLLEVFLRRVGIERRDCFVGLVTGAVAKSFKFFAWDSEPVQAGLKQLADDLRRFQPHMVLALGNAPLRALRAENISVDDWRGSLLEAREIVPGVKMMATYHPERILQEFNLTGVVDFDMKRLAAEAKVDGLHIPVDKIEVDLSFDELLARLASVRRFQRRVAVDIEGYVDYVSCIGFATSHNEAFVVPFMRADGTSRWSETEEVALWEAVAGVLEDPAIPKVLQNSLYDAFVLAWSYGIVIRGITDDTMLKHFELYCELEKTLGFQTSIYTRHPYYKFQRKSDDERIQLEYCGRDCCRTLECCDEQEKRLKPQQREHYRFNMSLLAPLLYMELRGIRYDKQVAARRLAEVQDQIYVIQDEINREAARSRPKLQAFFDALASGKPDALAPFFAEAFCTANPKEKREVEEVCWQPMQWRAKSRRWVKAGKRVKELPEGACNVNDCPGVPDFIAYERIVKIVERNCPVAITTLADARRFAKDSTRADCHQAIQLVEQVNAAPDRLAQRNAQLASLLGLSIKVNATGEGGDAQWYLYEHCKLPKQFKKEANRLTTKLASDDEALIKAYLKSGNTDAQHDQRALRFLAIRRLITQTKTLCADADFDGRIRCGYNLVGTETHRLTCYESPTGSGYNLQTVTKAHRDLFSADEDCWLCQRDLSGADGWTVAAYAAMLGDTTMLEDYRAKLKPAQILTLMLEQGASVNAIPRDQLKPLCKPITEETHWQYFAMKRVQHGGCFTAGHELLTPNGWVAIESLGLHQPIACYDLQTRRIHFELPSHMTAFHYTGKLYDFEGHSMSLTVTSDHRMPYVTNNNPKWITAAEMHARKSGSLPVFKNGCLNNSSYVRRSSLKSSVREVKNEPVYCPTVSTGYVLVRRAGKICVSGNSYLMGRNTMSDQILTDSFKKDGKPIYVAPGRCEAILEDCFFKRYPGIRRWHDWMAAEIASKGVLTASNGFTRRFHARKDDRSTIGKALAHLPQVYTTYATTLALARLWYDPENVNPDGSLRVEPLHTVHDSLITQWRKDITEWAKAKMAAWFDNPIQIARETITIPASGTYGPDWKHQDYAL